MFSRFNSGIRPLNCKGTCDEEVECLSKEGQAEGNIRVERTLSCRKDVHLFVGLFFFY